MHTPLNTLRADLAAPRSLDAAPPPEPMPDLGDWAHAEAAPDDNWIAVQANQRRLRVPLALENALAGVIMLLLGLITLANVLARYVFHVSFAFTEEYSSVLLYCLVFVTSSTAVAKNAHIKMTFFTQKLPRRQQKWAEILGFACVVLCLGVTAWYGGVMTWDAWQSGETSSGIGHPMWIYLIWLPILCLLGLCRALGCIVRLCAVKID